MFFNCSVMSSNTVCTNFCIQYICLSMTNAYDQKSGLKKAEDGEEGYLNEYTN